MSTRIARFPALLLSLLFLVALVLTGFNLSAALPRAQWGAALASAVGIDRLAAFRDVDVLVFRPR